MFNELDLLNAFSNPKWRSKSGHRYVWQQWRIRKLYIFVEWLSLAYAWLLTLRLILPDVFTTLSNYQLTNNLDLTKLFYFSLTSSRFFRFIWQGRSFLSSRPASALFRLWPTWQPTRPHNRKERPCFSGRTCCCCSGARRGSSIQLWRNLYEF